MIISIILLLILALALWGIYMLAGKSVNGVPLSIIGIILILIWLGAAYYFLTAPVPWHRVAVAEETQPSI
jgi:hypothetical protein